MKKENIYKFLLIGLFALISIAVPVATIISSAQLPENAFSENENRYLEKMPKFIQLKNEFQENGNIIFLTVSIDQERTRDKWLKAIKENNMTG